MVDQNSNDDIVLIFDVHNLIFRNIFPAWEYDQLDSKFSYWKYLMMSGIIKHIKMFKPTKVVLAVDSTDIWRKDVLPSYKGTRAGKRNKSKVDFSKFFPVMDSFLDDLKNLFDNFYYLRVDRTEADDVIAVLTKEVLTNKKVIAISTDSDLHQLLQHKNYQQYDPIKKKLIKHVNPEHDLLIKIIKGDKSDDIDGVLPRTGKVNAEKIFKTLDKHMENKAFKEAFDLNTRLIDLSTIPIDIRNRIKNEFNSVQLNKYNGNKMFKFLVKHRLNYFLESIDSYVHDLKRIG